MKSIVDKYDRKYVEVRRSPVIHRFQAERKYIQRPKSFGDARYELKVLRVAKGISYRKKE